MSSSPPRPPGPGGGHWTADWTLTSLPRAQGPLRPRFTWSKQHFAPDELRNANFT